MALSKAGRPKTKGWVSVNEASKRLGISSYSIKEAIANGTEFDRHEIFKVSEKRTLISAAAIERRKRLIQTKHQSIVNSENQEI